jgi:hypothetical protein
MDALTATFYVLSVFGAGVVGSFFVHIVDKKSPTD